MRLAGAIRAAMCSLLLLVWMTTVVLMAHGQQLPNQPAAFASRGASPFLAYSFRQSQCVMGTVSSDVSASIPLNLAGGVTTSCPTRNGSENAIVGVTLNASTPSASVAVKSAPLGSSFDPVTVPGVSNKAFSVEIWFSTTQLPVSGDDNVLLELGGASGSGTAQGNGVNEFHFRIAYRKRVAQSDDGLSIQYSLQRNSGAFNLASASVSRNAGDFGDTDFDINLESIGTGSPGTIFMLVVTIDSITVAAYLGRMGGSLGTNSGSGFGLPIRNFSFPSTSVVRVGCTRSPGSNDLRNFPGSIHFVGFYDSVLSPATAASLLAAGLPNSLPAVRDASLVTLEDISGVINLNQPSIVNDVDGNVITGFWVNRPNVGTLRYDGTSILVDNFFVSNITLLTYLSTPNATTGSAVSCSGQEHARFTFWATDSLCDRNDSAPGTANCKSPVAATARICVMEQNDAPTIVVPPTTVEFPVFTEANNKIAFTVSCSDIDNTTSVFGLDRVRIVSNSNSTLGRVVVDPLGTGNCSGLRGNNLNVSFSTTQTSARTATLTFCYEAFATTTTSQKVGKDVITYQCIDKMGATATGTLTVVVNNALIAGCGPPTTTRQQWINGLPCYERGVEDQPLLLRLSGFDAVASHTPSRHFFRIDTLPSMGKLYRLDGTQVVAGAGIPANSATVTNTSSVFSFPANQVATPPGNLTLVFIPAVNAFNAICGLSVDPTRNAANGRARCGGSEVVPLVYHDGLNQPLNLYNPCGNAVSGCPLTFSFSLGYDDTPLDNIDNPFFGPSALQIFRVDVVGVNDGNGILTGPVNLTMARTNVDFKLNSDASTTSTAVPPLRYSDPDGDTYRVGFVLNVQTRRAIVKAPSFVNPPSSEAPGYARMTFVEGGDCLGLGGTSCFFEGRAFTSDLNRFFDSLEFTTTVSSRSNDTFNVTIYDGAALPNEYQPSGAQTIEDTSSVVLNHEIVLLFGRSSPDGRNGGNLLPAELWVGITLGILAALAVTGLALRGRVLARAKRREVDDATTTGGVVAQDLVVQERA